MLSAEFETYDVPGGAKRVSGGTMEPINPVALPVPGRSKQRPRLSGLSRLASALGAPYALTGFGEGGHADWAAELSLVEFTTPSTVTHQTGACSIRWQGMNKPVDDPAAVCSTHHTN